ncbi:MAG: F0F1 ATP synthase subunit alpha, partial [Candidatus Aminicenantes bacterium]|nr:F0F1 ATP synthase subunit alpha [Candidatus Aminicenantes bacterium]
DLAQFRELEAFTQFGSDLDKATIDQLERGRRLSELLKQNEGVPMTVANQVIVIFAGTNGYLDEFPVDSIGKYEEKLLEFVEQEHSKILDDIRKKRKIDTELEQDMRNMLEKFAEEFRSFLSK